jgi:hypothetical protein
LLLESVSAHSVFFACFFFFGWRKQELPTHTRDRESRKIYIQEPTRTVHQGREGGGMGEKEEGEATVLSFYDFQPPSEICRESLHFNHLFWRDGRLPDPLSDGIQGITNIFVGTFFVVQPFSMAKPTSFDPDQLQQ